MLSTVTLIGVSPADTVLVDATAAYPEGPLWRDGKLLYVEYAGPGIKVWDGKQTKPYWSREYCGASGLITYRRNHILVACYDANEIVELDETGKQIRAVDKDVGRRRRFDVLRSNYFLKICTRSSGPGLAAEGVSVQR